ncbi:cellulose-binding protein [Plantactinospora endophytica]|uniref:Cellulose-binding protein n=1 Tax=Plantactinospora endophytica TaxID=673535 RepID=A0ABQ4EDZ0_9ACTN|nr:cellulose-binding protein [Plantactinospora endophytica]GIG92936.1 hypothetical protein Pen02_78720 [Plantactinospora endophytica]
MSAPEPTRPRFLAAAPWLVVLAGVLVMIILFVLATGYFSSDLRRTSGVPDPAWPFAQGGTPSSAAGPASPTDGVPTVEPALPTPTTARPAGARNPAPSRTTPSRGTTPPPSFRPTTAAPKPAEPALTGRYRVLADYRDSFIAEVLVRNTGGAAQSWTVELRFRNEVHGLRNYWIEGAPRPSADRDDGRYVFRSGVPLSGNRSDPLRFHLERWGDSERPISCTVNGRACDLG